MRNPIFAQSRVFDGGGGNEGIVKMVLCRLLLILLRFYVLVARLQLLTAVRESEVSVGNEVVSQRTKRCNGVLKAEI